MSTTAAPWTVTALTGYIAALFERDEMLRDLWVTAEVSNWKRTASGHIYFSLKDGGATIAAVMWRASANVHSWLPNEGDQVLAHGYVGVYGERGAYQLYVNQLRPAGRGQLYARFEALKAQLAAEGLFAPERKRPIPARPRRIGIITSADAAALRDILRILAARWPLVDVLLFPTLVQGSEAPSQIVAALQAANDYHQQVEPIDTLILARGGGSIEDLWSFNDQRVAYAIAASALPVVCGVGHETDFTIADFVADLRAPTPSAAAAAVTPAGDEVLADLYSRQQQLVRNALQRLSDERWEVNRLAERLARRHPRRQLDQQRQRLDDRTRRLQSALERSLRLARNELRMAQLRLQALNPVNILQRGYSIVQKVDGSVVVDPSQSQIGEALLVRSKGGDYAVQRLA
jgi:exodeoxyribonuclease VII large subunit